jgi:phage terminase Nu1 subunit (DNA packaging protein)
VAVGVQQLAKVLGVSRRRVNQLVLEGMPKASHGQYDLGACLLWAYQYEKSRKSTAQPIENADLVAEKRRLTKAQADDAEISLAERRGQLVPISKFESEMAAMITTARQNLLNLSARIAPELEGQSREVIRHRVRKSIYDALTALSTGEMKAAEGHCPHCAQEIPDA